jgi:hypothetical protein
MALSGSGWLAMHAAARALGVQWRVGTRRYSAVLGVARGWARARAVTCIVTLVGAQWCLCRSAASGARRHSVALNGARARARWRGGTNRGTRRRFAAHGGARRPRWNAVACGRRHRAVTPLGGARRRFAAHGWRSAALGGALQRTVALSGTRWNAVAGGRRHRAVTPHGGARWRANVCTLWHSVTSGGARRPALACVAVSAHLKSAGWLLQRSSADQR